jgi:hypothetical protein
MGNKAAFFSNAKSRQSEARGGDAPQIAIVRASDIAAVSDNPRLRIGLFPEISKIGGLEFLKKRIVLVGKRFWRDNRRSLVRAPSRLPDRG